MARIRSIKPVAFTSESMAAVSVEARWTFAGLWTYCDDEGFGRADPRLIKGQIWPLDDDVFPDDVDGYLKELEREQMICRFEHDGRWYLHVPSWCHHQSIQKPTASKFPVCPVHYRSDSALSPTPPGWVGGGKSTTSALREDSSSATSRNREQGREEEEGTREDAHAVASDGFETLDGFLVTPDGVTTPDATQTRGPTLGQLFEEFWAAYPSKVGKMKARPAWDKARKTASIEEILAGAIRIRDDPRRDPKFTPHPTTWLNRGGWMDEGTSAPTTEPEDVDKPEGW